MSLALLLRRGLACAAIVLCALTAGAATTSRLRVQLTGSDCARVTAVWAVMNDADESPQRIPLSPIAGSPCQWSGTAPVTFSTRRSHFSLRLGFARTECHEPAEEEEREFETVALLTFPCCSPEAVRTITVTTEPPIAVSYVREVPAERRSGRTSSTPTPCIEHGTFTAGPPVVDHVQFRAETVYLQIGRFEPDPKILGLRLDDLQNWEKSRSVRLTRDGVTHRLNVQRAQGSDRTPPVLSPNALDLDGLRLRTAQLESITVEVK